MNPEIEKGISDLAVTAAKAGKDIISFLEQQAPDVANQMVRFYLIQSIIDVVILAPTVVACAYFAKRVCGKISAATYSDNTGWVILLIILIIIALIALWNFADECGTVLQCIYAPKAIILGFIKTLK